MTKLLLLCSGTSTGFCLKYLNDAG